MMKYKTLRYTILVCLSAFLVLSVACAERMPMTEDATTEEQNADLERRIAILDIKYEILLKDVPPQTDTMEFRLNMSEARDFIQKGRVSKAVDNVAGAEVWIDQARVDYYQRHVQAVKNERAPKAYEDYRSESMVFLNKSRAAKAEGDTELSRMYLQAAIEQARLGLLFYENKPERIAEYVQAAKRLAAIYNEAGEPDLASEVDAQGYAELQAVISSLQSEITECLDGKSARCQTKVLQPGQEKDIRGFRQTRAWLAKRNELLTTITKNTYKYYPNRVPLYDYSAKINSWSSYWEDRWANYSSLPDSDTPQQEFEKEQAEQRAAYRKMVQDHNRSYCGGGIPSQNSSDLEVVYQAHELRGNRIVVKGHIKNISDQPIYNPKVTICGEVVSNQERLGFYNLDPDNIGGFALELKQFSVDEFRNFGFKIPQYKIMVLYQDYYGTEHKVYREIK